MAIMSQEGVAAWNIVIRSLSDTQAGAYQPPTNPFLTWRDFFDDLHLCFDLEAVSASKQLALWVRSRDDAVANEIDTPCIYSHPDSPQSGILDRLITVPSSGLLNLSLVAHQS